MEIFREIFASISHNKSRFLLTGVSVGWGIFLLIVLLGLGNGISNGISSAWLEERSNKVIFEPKETMLPFGGLAAGRKMTFTEEDAALIVELFGKNISNYIAEVDTAILISQGNKFSYTDIAGLYPGYQESRGISMLEGRDINLQDIKDKRKVCLISTNLCNRLFPDEPAKSLVGRQVEIYGIPFIVIGVYKPNRSYNVTRTVIAPFTTVQSLYFRNDHLSKFTIIVEGLTSKKANNDFMEAVQGFLATRKNYSPQDKRAITITNTMDFFLEVNGLFTTISLFLWIVGIATLVAGVIGISNIMLITVKERTRELAVRKAMGASSGQIIRLVLFESVIVTVIFGYIGMMLGIGVIELVDMLTAASSTDAVGNVTSVFVNPSIDLGIVLGANVIMIVSGLLAGYMPAKTAVRIKLVDALASID